MGGGECRTNDYGAAAYWDARYSSSSSSSGGGGGGVEFFEWYQTYEALRPLLRARLPTSSRVLMLGCGNSLLSEDMVKDGYEEMDARDMSYFGDETFDCVLDKGTLDAMMCGDDAPLGASKMLAEVARLLRPGGIYMLITYGTPKERLQLLYQAGFHRKIELYIMPTPGYQSKWSKNASLAQPIIQEVSLTEDGQLPPDCVLKDPESHFIYVCQKSDAANGTNSVVANEGETTASK
ncbi:EEF1A lysine methyltransferase 4 isoform X2 [Oryza brachyantha]|uniref:EEF1A lysine methyltransferase 4 isoform X2 n=1 Tax=Oryza brachyantha TaxID=4533 RepID=UPI001ADBED5D|nr:EEF1A lysine methyltransferase 4 isoform X2 [Oryza brachyantha]